MDFKPEALRLKDKVVLITGGGGTNSIGRSIGLRLALEGARIGVLDIDSKARRRADEIEAAGGRPSPSTATSPTSTSARRRPSWSPTPTEVASTCW